MEGAVIKCNWPLSKPGSTGAFEMRHSFLYFFSLVRVFLCTNFSSTLRTVYESPQKLALTAVYHMGASHSAPHDIFVYGPPVSVMDGVN